MTYEEALKVMKNEEQCVIRAENCNRDCAKCDLLKPAQQILEAYNITKEALEKQISKKSIGVYCPVCEDDCDTDADSPFPNYCPNCGQRLEW